jgi:ABC-type transport system involved in multi-copper enzyme maturation permease subunit
LRGRELLRKDLAELAASRAWWLLLAVTGLLTGQAFITAVASYGEMSAPGALAQGLSPLDGIVVPVLGAYDLAITLLFPFVAIRLLASEKSSDALKLMLQWPVTRGAIIASKAAALLAAWLLSLLPFALAMALWASYGGHLAAGELVNVLTGYTLRFLLTAALSLVAAAVMPGAANAAVAVLAFTIGTWALDFIAAGHGGLLQQLAGYTPAAALRAFERGLFRVDVALMLLILSLAGFAVAALWLDLGRAPRARVMRAAGVLVLAALACAGASQVRRSFDLSENQRSSFPPAVAHTLAGVREPLTMTVFLSAEDPRLADLESGVLAKLRRTMDVRVVYPLAGRSGLFDNDERYGTIEYVLGRRRAVNRSTTEAIVLETIDELAGLQAPAAEESSYAGWPLRATPRGVAILFYAIWPLAVVIAARRSRRTG